MGLHCADQAISTYTFEYLCSEEKLKREEMAKQRSAATETCAPAATLAALQAPREEQSEAHHVQKEDPMQEEKAPTVRKERRWDCTVLISTCQMVKQTPEEPAHATATTFARALEVASPRAASVEPSPRREMPTVGSSSRPVCLINIGDEDEEPAIPLVCSPPPKSHQRSAAFPSPKMRAVEPTSFSSLEETSESHHNQDDSKHIAHSLASPVVPSPTPDAGSGNRKRSRLRQTQPSTAAAALVERNLCSCGQPGYGLMVPLPRHHLLPSRPRQQLLFSPRSTAAASVADRTTRSVWTTAEDTHSVRVHPLAQHLDHHPLLTPEEQTLHTTGALYTCQQCKTDLEQHA
jgi:hypothetical protein